jgi:hypothetical protein
MVMRKAILPVAAVTIVWSFAAGAQTATPSSTPATTQTDVNSQTTVPGQPRALVKPSKKPAAKTSAKTTPSVTKPAAVSNAAAVNHDPCDTSATTTQVLPDATANSAADTSVQCHQDKSKPMQGGLAGH